MLTNRPTSRLKSAAISVKNAATWLVTSSPRLAPAAALVLARAGSAVFNNIIFFGTLSKLFKTEYLKPKAAIAIIFATLGFFGAFGTAVVTRGFNTFRKQNEVPKATDPETESLLNRIDEKDPDSQQPTQTMPNRKIEPATCCYPGIETDSLNTGYRLNQIVTGIYGFGSAASAVLSTRSLIFLLQAWMRFEYEDTCGEQSSSAGKLIVANLAMVLLMYANVRSLMRYNVPALREYYRKLFIEARLFTPDNKLFVKKDPQNPKNKVITALYDENERKISLVAYNGFLYDEKTQEPVFSYEGKIFHRKKLKRHKYKFIPLTLKSGWSEISKKDKGQAFIGVMLGTIGVWYANETLIKVFNEQMLCHLTGKVYDVPKKINDVLPAIGSTSNFLVTGLMTLGAIYNNQEKIRKEDNEDKANIASELANQTASDILAENLAQPQPHTEEKETSEFGRAAGLIDKLSRLNSFNMGEGMFAAFPALIGKIAGDDSASDANHPAADHPLTLAASVIAAAVVVRNQRELDLEGHAREAQTRRELREAGATEYDGDVESAATTTRSSIEFASLASNATAANDAKSLPSRVGMFHRQPRLTLDELLPHQIADTDAAVLPATEPRISRREKIRFNLRHSLRTSEAYQATLQARRSMQNNSASATVASTANAAAAATSAASASANLVSIGISN